MEILFKNLKTFIMKNIKISMIAVIAIVMGIAVSAFNTTATQSKESATYSIIYELKLGGDMLERSDWIPSVADPACETDYSNTPCRIKAEADGDHPTEVSFEDVLVGSNNFQQAYANVTYKP